MPTFHIPQGSNARRQGAHGGMEGWTFRRRNLLGRVKLAWVPESISTGLPLFSTSGKLADVGL